MALTNAQLGLMFWGMWITLFIIGCVAQMIIEILHQRKQIELAKRPYNHRQIAEPPHLEHMGNQQTQYYSNTFWQAFNEP